MTNDNNRHSVTALTAIAAVVAILLHACASIGNPEGGPRDYTPPQFVGARPSPGATGVTGNKVTLTFNELVQLVDQQKRVTVSPTQHNMPRIAVNGRRVEIELRDTLLPETTYVIDLSDAVADNNEGNRMERLHYMFSTGETLDTLGMSGIVLRARDLEPMQYVLVGVHSNLNDTAFTRLPLERIARTDDRGRFTIRGLKPGRYRVYALSDMDGDYRMARSEDVAWLDTVIEPSTRRFTSMDTIFTFDHKVDTVVEAEHTLLLPDDLLLPMFNEGFRASYLKNTSRLDRRRLQLVMAAPQDTMPHITPIKPKPLQQRWMVPERYVKEASDSTILWLTDTTLIAADSLTLAISYPKTVGNSMVATTDTIHFVFKQSRAELKQLEQERKQREQRAKRLAQLLEKQAEGSLTEDDELDLKDLARDTITVVQHLKLEADGNSGSKIEITDSLRFKVDEPIASINQRAVHLLRQRMPDSVWVAVDGVPPLTPRFDGDCMGLTLPMVLQPDSTYAIELDSLAITGIYGTTTNKFRREFKVKDESEYGSLRIDIRGPAAGDSAIVQLLDGSERIVRSTVIVGGGTATFRYVTPETYYVRLVHDRNGNGLWDTGNYARHIQPEDVFYYPQRLRVRRNWDISEAWDIYATAVDLQKPEQIRKNKPETKSKLLKPKETKKPEEDEEDEFNSNAFGRGTYSGNRYQDYHNSR